MKQYLINDTTLSALGDAIRTKKGESACLPTTIIAQTSNYNGEGDFTSTKADSMEKIVNIPAEATGVKIRLLVKSQYSSYYGNLTLYYGESSSSTKANYYQPSSLTEYNLEFDSSIKYLRFDWSNYWGTGTGFHAEIDPVGVPGELDPSTHYTPTELVTQISDNLLCDLTKEYSGNLPYFDYEGRLDWAVPQMTFKDVTNAEKMFNGSSLKQIPSLVFAGSNAAKTNVTQIFGDSKITIAPTLSYYATTSGSYIDKYGHLTYGLKYIREYPSTYFQNLNPIDYYISTAEIFYKNYSVRTIPTELIKFYETINKGRHNSTMDVAYYQGFAWCYALDEVILPKYLGTQQYTGNLFTSCAAFCIRAKTVKFLPTDDGSVWTLEAKSQVIDLSNCVGYCDNVSYSSDEMITSYNSGIDKSKRVIDDESYNRLKNDPDWYCGLTSSASVPYSRYNHDSAVETINSLPDTSVYLAAAGGTNTIKFKGAAGSATDGGAINTLTEEEISVATEKGWTVTLV